jgi:hypothetical protein
MVLIPYWLWLWSHNDNRFTRIIVGLKTDGIVLPYSRYMHFVITVVVLDA